MQHQGQPEPESEESAFKESRQTNLLAASNRAANRYGYKSTESLVSTENLNQSSV